MKTYPTYQEFFRLCFVVFNFFCGCYEYFLEGEGAKMLEQTLRRFQRTVGC